MPKVCPSLTRKSTPRKGSKVHRAGSGSVPAPAQHDPEPENCPRPGARIQRLLIVGLGAVMHGVGKRPVRLNGAAVVVEVKVRISCR